MTAFTVIGFVQTRPLMLWEGLVAGSFAVCAPSQEIVEEASTPGLQVATGC